MKKKLKNLGIVGIAAITLFSTSYLNTLAGDENISFKFNIKSWGGNGQESDGRYRNTPNAECTWKVKLVTSGEGAGKDTTFWLELYDGTNVSGDITATQGGKAIYKEAYSSASKATVYLTGENNNLNGDTYSVSGYWDEETGVYF